MAIERRQFLGLAALTGVAALAAGCTQRTTAPNWEVGTDTGPPVLIEHEYLSGASCIGAADGEFARWRDNPVNIAATWAYNGSPLRLMPGEEYGRWQGHIDFAPMFTGENEVFSWADCAAGRYDTKFTTELEGLKAAWGDRTGTVYYRFQHEFNGSWFPWSVRGAGDSSNFIAGWRHFAEVFRGVFAQDPRFKLVWSVATGLPSKGFHDIRSLYPGHEYVDVISLDYFDFFDIETEHDWIEHRYSLDAGGGPVGIGAWLAFAHASGKPMCVSEWGNQYGDNELFIRKMHWFLREYAYTGAGRAAGIMIYDIYFNQLDPDGDVSTQGDFRLQIRGKDHPKRPEAARAYRELWSEWNSIRRSEQQSEPSSSPSEDPQRDTSPSEDPQPQNSPSEDPQSGD